MKARIVPAWVLLVNAAVLSLTFYTWRFSYFGLDDFNNFYWIQRLDQSFWEMLWAIVNPFADAFRPFGWLFYSILWRLFDWNPLPYHIFAWTLHACNVILLFFLLSKATSSALGAGTGALLFAFRANFADIYWSFGTIFELLALLLMLLALWVYRSDIPFQWKVVTIALLYLLAVKSKEMAITLPAVLVLYEICFRKHKVDSRLALFFCILAVFGAAFGYSRFVGLGTATRSEPYYMDFSVLTFGRGYGWYFDHLYGMNVRWGAWMIATFFLAAWFVYRRQKRGLFFLGYTYVALLPVVFMINHRFEFFWYVPFLGIAGLVAMLVAGVERWIGQYVSPKILVPASVVGLTVFAAVHVGREWRASQDLIRNQKSLALEYERFVTAVQSIPPPAVEAQVYFRSLPSHFNAEVLHSATQGALHRTDVSVKVVDEFPAGCLSCVEFAR